MMTQPHELTWGSLILASPVEPDLPWRIETLAGDFAFGNPVPLVEVVPSLLSDGSLSVVNSYGNREIRFRVKLSAPTGVALAQAEAAFLAEVRADMLSPLSWTPPALDAWPCVFDVVAARFDGDYGDGWDFDEAFRHCRYYSVTLECLPWARSSDVTVIPALPAPPDPDDPPEPVLIDACSSTTGWTREAVPSSVWTGLTGPSVSGGAVGVTGSLRKPFTGDTDGPIGALLLRRTGTVSMSGTPYLAVEIEATSTRNTPEVSVRYNPLATGDQLAYPLAIIPTATPDVSTYYFAAPTSFNVLQVRTRTNRSLPVGSVGQTVTLRVHNVAKIASVPGVGSDGFQVARTAVIGGTAPTQAAVRFASDLDDPPTSPEALMDRTAMVYTGANPAIPMRPYLDSSAAPTPDGAAVSGEVNDLSADAVYLIPVAELVEANYALMARLRFNGTYVIAWSAKIVDSTGADMPGSVIVESGQMRVVSSADIWTIRELGSIPMPILRDLDPDSPHMVKVTLSMASSGSDVDIDDAWVMDTDNGAVTVLNYTGTTGPYKIELRSPWLGSPRPAVIGTWDAYGSQDVTRLVERMGTHRFEPGLLHILTVADGAKYAPCELEYYERFHTYPGPALASSEEA